MTLSARAAGGWPATVRGLYLVAMAMFLVTVVIGILNGLDLVDFNVPELRNTLLTHVHAGTLGWISLGIIATTFWLAREDDRRLAWAFAIVVPIYVAAFYSGNYPARAITGTVLLVAIAWLFVWAWRLAMARRSLPTLAVALGLTTFTYGAVIGVLLQVQGAIGQTLFPANSDAIGAHAATMTFGYLVLVAMGFLEWRLKGTVGRPTLGVIQVAALFLGSLILAVALLFLDPQSVQAAGGLNLLCELVAVVLFVIRIWPAALRTSWLDAAPGRHVHAAAIFVVVAMALFMYLVFKFISAGDPSALPLGVLVALDHTVFIGVITNLVFGSALALSADRADRWPWAGQVVFWVTNGGLVLFAIGLVVESAEVKRIGAPIMGVGVLIGLAVIALRLWSSSLSGAAEDAVQV